MTDPVIVSFRDDPARLAQCFAIRREVFVEEQGVSEAEEIDGHDADRQHYLAFLDGRAAATARLWPIEGGVKIQRVAVLRTARGTGLGAALMRRIVEDILAEGGERQIVLASQMQAIPFYEKIGFVAHGPEFLDADIPHRNMSYRPAKKAPRTNINSG